MQVCLPSPLAVDEWYFRSCRGYLQPDSPHPNMLEILGELVKNVGNLWKFQQILHKFDEICGKFVGNRRKLV